MTVARSLWGYIERRDQRLMRRMNRWRAPRWIRIWTITVTRLGDGWIWYALGFLLLGGCVRSGCSGNLFVQGAETPKPAATPLSD